MQMHLSQTFAASMSGETLTERVHGLRDRFEELSLPEVELDRLRAVEGLRAAGANRRAEMNERFRQQAEVMRGNDLFADGAG